MKRNRLLVGIFSLAVPLAACSSSDVSDEMAEEGEDLALGGKGDGAEDNSTFFSLRYDVRRCAWPMCGGYFVKRVNRPKTRCADGVFRSECYVTELDTTALADLGEEQVADMYAGIGKVLLRGSIESKPFDGFGDFGNLAVLTATELWRGGTDNAPKGVFMRISDSGIVCITYPCPTMQEAKLNGYKQTHIAGLDFAPSGASEDQLMAAYEALMTDDGLIVAGYRTSVSGPGGKAKARSVHQYYLRVQPAQCVRGGCSGQLCYDPTLGNGYSTCEWLPWYACYDMATCERQADGSCGWTMTEALQACFDTPPE